MTTSTSTATTAVAERPGVDSLRKGMALIEASFQSDVERINDRLADPANPDAAASAVRERDADRAWQIELMLRRYLEAHDAADDQLVERKTDCVVDTIGTWCRMGGAMKVLTRLEHYLTQAVRAAVPSERSDLRLRVHEAARARIEGGAGS